MDYLKGVADNNEIFTLDDLGNRELVELRDGSEDDYNVDVNNNRYIDIDGTPFSYDDAGNLTEDKDGYQYTYDYENRIVEIKDSGNTTVAEFDYDALGRRIRKIDSIDSETSLYYYNNNWQVLTETDAAGNTQRWYVYGNYIDEPLVMVDADDDQYYYLQNHIYSAVALVDESGTIVERYEYDAYGEPNVLDADFSDDADGVSDYDNPYLFTGRRWDFLDSNNLKIQYSRNRYYDYYTGRWLSQDPLNYIDGMNFYEYCGSRATIERDPNGEKAVKAGEYVPSRGKMKFQLMPGMEMFRSDMMLDFIPNSNARKYCNEIGFGQIFGREYVSTPIDETYTKEWKIDTSFPFPGSYDSYHWVKGGRKAFEGGRAYVGDYPGWYPFWHLYDPYVLEQTFETCAICLKGCEKGANYGCIVWSHSFSRSDKKNKQDEWDYFIHRYGGYTGAWGWLSKGHSVKIYLQRHRPHKPTQDFHKIIDKKIRSYVN